jgi:hypothetical protein
MAPGERPPFLDDITGTTFDSHLEIPTSGDPHHNATLTLVLRYKLEFADGKNIVPGVIVKIEGTARARDGTGLAQYITDWDDQSRSNFTRLMWRSQKIWTYKFMLIPPRNYSGLDFRHPLPGHFVRPNVMCALQMEPWGAPHIRIRVVRANLPEAFRPSTNSVPPRNMLIDETAARSPSLGHELGHVLGMPHIKTILGDQACIADNNAPRCYGETALELANIMGAGRDLWPLNAAPWMERIASHTQTQAASWTATMDMKTPPETLTFAEHVLRSPKLIR